MALTEAEFVILGVVGGGVPGGPPGHVLVTIGHYNNVPFCHKNQYSKNQMNRIIISY